MKGKTSRIEPMEKWNSWRRRCLAVLIFVGFLLVAKETINLRTTAERTEKVATAENMQVAKAGSGMVRGSVAKNNTHLSDYSLQRSKITQQEQPSPVLESSKKRNDKQPKRHRRPHHELDNNQELENSSPIVPETASHKNNNSSSLPSKTENQTVNDVKSSRQPKKETNKGTEFQDASSPTVSTSNITDWDAIPCPGNTQPWHSCNLTDFYFGYPVILISFGRSGSSVTWDSMTALASPRRGQYFAESTGSNIATSLAPLKQMDPNEHGKCWMQRILCEHQENNRVLTKQGKGKSKIIGTKWKPFLAAFNHTKAREALQWIAATPYIKVVYNERNPLDITISRHKHKAFNVPSHCFRGECVKKHAAHEKDLVLPLDFMWESMTNLTQETAAVKGILDEFHVDRVEVLYERLYYANHTEEWMKLFRHLGVGPRENLTRAELMTKIVHAETHPMSRRDAIANYDQVQAALNGTDFAKYLMPASLAAETLDSWRRKKQRRTRRLRESIDSTYYLL